MQFMIREGKEGTEGTIQVGREADSKLGIERTDMKEPVKSIFSINKALTIGRAPILKQTEFPLGT